MHVWTVTKESSRDSKCNYAPEVEKVDDIGSILELLLVLIRHLALKLRIVLVGTAVDATDGADGILEGEADGFLVVFDQVVIEVTLVVDLVCAIDKFLA